MNCHGGPLLSDHAFHNIGLSFYGRRNQDLGRYEATRDPADLGKFRTPSLRNVARAGPWMHNGLFPDMRGLLRMYDAGMGRDPVPREPPDPLAPRKSEHIRPLDLSADEIDAPDGVHEVCEAGALSAGAKPAGRPGRDQEYGRSRRRLWWSTVSITSRRMVLPARRHAGLFGQAADARDLLASRWGSTRSMPWFCLSSPIMSVQRKRTPSSSMICWSISSTRRAAALPVRPWGIVVSHVVQPWTMSSLAMPSANVLAPTSRNWISAWASCPDPLRPMMVPSPKRA